MSTIEDMKEVERRARVMKEIRRDRLKEKIVIWGVMILVVTVPLYFFMTGDPKPKTTIANRGAQVTSVATSTTPIEKNAVISEVKYSRSDMLKLIDAMVPMVTARGWRCDSVSSASPWMFSTGFSLKCNRYRYKYEFEDRGGRWVVILK